MTTQTQPPRPEPLEVIIVGAGFAGVCAGIKLKERVTNNFVILEKAAGVGGTWWHNTYPGAACDIQSHLYCYSFEPNPNWTRKYSGQAEIQAYIERCVDKYGLRDHLRLNSEVIEFAWSETEKLWHARLAEETLTARHIIFASGGLHLPAYPDITGMEDFSGESMHSAQWNHDVEFTDKTVAVIGSAASAVQLIPELAEVARQVDVYQRTPNYISPRNDRSYSKLEQTLFTRWPWLNRLYRQLIFMRGEWLVFPIVKTRHASRWRQRAQHMVKKRIRASVDDPATCEAMIPEFPLGCKRILIADNFYDAINRPNVSLQTAGIARIQSEGIVNTEGETLPADIIVYATGFDLEGYMRQTEVTGPGGIKLSEAWSDMPQAYKGGFISGFPNFYMTTGPNTGVGSTSVVYMIEAQLGLILQAIEKTRGGGTIAVREEAQNRYNHDIQSALQETVWAGNCSSWYKREDGRIPSLYPYDARTFLRDHQELVEEDFEVSVS